MDSNAPLHISLVKIAFCFILSSLIACVPQQEVLDTEQIDDQDELGTINAPQITMGLPVTLSNVVATNSNKVRNLGKSDKLLPKEAVSDPDECATYFDPHADFMENGYSMSRFLIGLSQQQSCLADFIMASVISHATLWVNQGVITLPENINDPEAPSHVQINRIGDTNQVWLYFHTPGADLPADSSDIQTFYLTWSGTENDMTGQFYMVNMPQKADDPDAPTGLRVDFVRTAASASNKIYLRMREGHSAGMSGFRIDVNRSGVGEEAIYSAKGLITFLGQPFPNLPEDVALPEFAVAVVADANGFGASSANFNQFAISIEVDNNQDGTIDSSIGEFDLGAYQFDINDTTYFNPALFDAADTQTAFVEQVVEWKYKSAGNAIYVEGSRAQQKHLLVIL